MSDANQESTIPSPAVAKQPSPEVLAQVYLQAFRDASERGAQQDLIIADYKTANAAQASQISRLLSEIERLKTPPEQEQISPS